MEGLLTLLDPQTLGPLLVSWAGRIVAAILIFVIGRWVALAVVGWIGKGLERRGIEPTLKHFLSSLTYTVLLVLVILTAVGALGVPTTNFLAIVGAAGLAIGLALRDSLANFSSGVMLVFFRPFKVGDYVEAGGVAGTVHSIRIFDTVFKTPDNRVITVPNSQIYGGTITNYSAEPNRRIDLVVGISYDDDIEKAKTLISGVFAADDRILDDPAPTVMLLELADSSVNIAVRPWVATSDYWAVREHVLTEIKRAFDAGGVSIPYPQRDVHIINQTAT
jgi:small conductance mechanosensitive channel